MFARVVSAFLLLLAPLVACSDDGEPSTAVSPTPSSASASPTPPAPSSPVPSPSLTPEPVWPLTGLPLGDGAPDRPALVVKVDNTGSARPQVGLSAADLVVEELVEGGATRLAVMYYSKLPPEVGPVRSIRTSDVGIVQPTGGALVASGGAGRVLRLMDDVGVTVVAEGSSGFSRDPSRRAPYSVMVDPEQVAASVASLGAPSVAYLPWADSKAAPPAGEPVTSVAVRFSGGHTTRWKWADGTWSRQAELAAKGDEFRPDNVLVLHVTTRDAGYTDPAGNPVPETVLDGSGPALLLTDGGAVEARWSKADALAPFALADGAGDPLAVPAGRTWIELVPEGGTVQAE